MANRTSTRKPRDLNQLAASIVSEATGEELEPTEHSGKNPAAVALGKLGGQKGGRARAERMTPEQRSAAARRAAEIRWAARAK